MKTGPCMPKAGVRRSKAAAEAGAFVIRTLHLPLE